MYASKHALFAEPGLIPQGLDTAQLSSSGARWPRRSAQGPRLWSSFETAAEAERAAAELLVHRVEVVVAGPEQPPVENGWHRVHGLASSGAGFSVTLEGGTTWQLVPSAVDQLSSVDWRDLDGLADLGVLLRVPELDRPVFFRARRLGTSAAGHDPLRRLLEACGRRLRRDARIRHQRLTEEAFGGLALTGDLLPLAVGVVDAIDSRPGELPGRPRW